MNKQNSIIGCGYIPHNVQAVCLKTKNNATLGEVKYKIISEVYERKFELSGLRAVKAGKKAVTHAAVNVLDTKPGLTYAVEYEPANLIRLASEPKTKKPEEKVEFIDRAQQIVEELEGIFSAGGGIAEKCGVVFFANSDNGNGKTSSGRCFIGGRRDRIIRSILEPCAENHQALELVRDAVTEAMLRSIFDGNEKKE